VSAAPRLLALLASLACASVPGLALAQGIPGVPQASFQEVPGTSDARSIPLGEGVSQTMRLDALNVYDNLKAGSQALYGNDNAARDYAPAADDPSYHPYAAPASDDPRSAAAPSPAAPDDPRAPVAPAGSLSDEGSNPG
jgi:hypothetical protein